MAVNNVASTTPMAVRLQAVETQMLQHLARARGDADAPMVELRDENDLVYTVRVHSRFVGVHDKNRYQNGVVSHRVHTRCEGTLAAGWSDNELDKPTAVEMPPYGHPRRQELIDFNVTSMAQSGGHLPPYEADGEQIKILSATRGHTSQVLRCIWYAMAKHGVNPPTPSPRNETVTSLRTSTFSGWAKRVGGDFQKRFMFKRARHGLFLCFAS